MTTLAGANGQSATLLQDFCLRVNPPVFYFLALFFSVYRLLVGLGTEFRSEKILRNRLGTVSGIPWKKVLIISKAFRGSEEEPISKLGTELNRTEFCRQICFTKQPK